MQEHNLYVLFFYKKGVLLMNKIITALLISVLGISVAQAADKSQHYVGINLGVSHSNDLGNSLNHSFGAGATTNEDQHDFSYGIKLGYNFNDWLGIEGRLTSLGDFDGNVAGVRGEFNDVYSGAVVGVARHSFDNGIGIQGKLGWAHTVGDLDYNNNHVAEFNSNDWTYGVGVSYSLTKSVDITADWDRLHDALDGHESIDNWSAGIKYNF